MRLRAAAESFQGGDGAIVKVADGNDAGARCHAVDVDRTGATLRHAAAELRAALRQAIVQNV